MGVRGSEELIFLELSSPPHPTPHSPGKWVEARPQAGRPGYHGGGLWSLWARPLGSSWSLQDPSPISTENWGLSAACLPGPTAPQSLLHYWGSSTKPQHDSEWRGQSHCKILRQASRPFCASLCDRQ